MPRTEEGLRRRAEREALRTYATRNVEERRERARRWRRENPAREAEIKRRTKLLSKYGISVEQYDEMLSRQDGKCAICRGVECPSGYRFAVDHCHKTGKNRGLLCRTCNLTLGRLKDDPETFDRAAAYLREYS